MGKINLDEESNVDVRQNDEYLSLDNTYRRIILLLFTLLIIGSQYLLSNYSYNNNDGFGLMFALYSLVNLAYPVIIAAVVIAITITKRNLKHNKFILDSICIWNFISLINGIIPILTFMDIEGSFFKSNLIVFEFIIIENLLFSIIGSIILRFYLINKIKE